MWHKRGTHTHTATLFAFTTPEHLQYRPGPPEWHMSVTVPVYGVRALLLTMPVPLTTASSLLYSLYLWKRSSVFWHTADKEIHDSDPLYVIALG